MVKKRILSLTLVIVMITSLLIVYPIAVLAQTSGTCGDKLTWTLSDDGKLVIRGEGDMTSAPWSTSYKSDITEVRIRYGVTSIIKNAFNGCENLTEVDIAESVTTIGGNAFYKCEQLTTVNLPQSVSAVGACAFGYCTNLEEINIPSGVTVIGDSMFFRCVSLKNVTLPNTIKEIERLAFYACDSLENIELKEGLESIGEEAFAFSALTSLFIPESVKGIDYSAFNYNSGLTLNVYDGSYALDYAKKYSVPYLILEKKKSVAEKLCDLINTQAANSCTVDVENQRVTLLSDVRLTQTLEIPTGGTITLDIGNYNVFGADDMDALNIPSGGRLNVIGKGTIKGGNVTESGYSGGDGISNSGSLMVKGPTFIGGDALGDYGYAGAGIETYGASTTYFTEGAIQGGEGDYSEFVQFERLNLTVVKESDDGKDYAVASEMYSYKKYLKAVRIDENLSAPAKLSALLNEIQPGTSVVLGNSVTLNKNFSCPYEIYMPTGEIIVLNFNGHTVTTDDFFMPFIIPEQAEIIFKGEGVLTNTGTPSGGIVRSAALISNDGKLTINGITVVGVGLNGIYNNGALTMQKGKIMVSDYSSGKDAIVNSGTMEVFGGEITGGNATCDGGSGGNGISAMSGVVPSDGTYPIKLYGGVLCGGKGLGDGENGRAISTRFNICEVCIAYESEDGHNYFVVNNAKSDMRYLKIVKENNKPEGCEGNLFVQNIDHEGEKVSFDLVLFSKNTISGNVYVAVYQGDRLTYIKPYTAQEKIMVSIDYAEGQKIKVFWWGDHLCPKSLSAEVKIQ